MWLGTTCTSVKMSFSVRTTHMLTNVLAGAQLLLLHFFSCIFNCECIEKIIVLVKLADNLTLFCLLVYLAQHLKKYSSPVYRVLKRRFELPPANHCPTIFPLELTLSRFSFTFPVSFPPLCHSFFLHCPVTCLSFH